MRARSAEERLLEFVRSLFIQQDDVTAYSAKCRRLLREVKRDCAERAVAQLTDQTGAIARNARAAITRPARSGRRESRQMWRSRFWRGRSDPMVRDLSRLHPRPQGRSRGRCGVSPCIHGNGFVLTVGGPTFTMDTPRGVVHFEMHSYCGPMPITKKRGREGDEHRIPDSHPFWEMVTRWAQSGQRVERGRCVVPPLCSRCHGTRKGEHRGGRNWRPCALCNGEGWVRPAEPVPAPVGPQG